MDDGKQTVEGVTESQVQTALPKSEGGRILVVRGKKKGSVGKLMSRDKQAGRATVRFDEELDYVSVDLDDIAEYHPH